MESQLSEEFDAGVAEDEIEASRDHYSLGGVPGTTWKALVIIGGVTTIAGILLELMTRGQVYPVPEYFPTPLGSAFALAVLAAGVVILVAGVALRGHESREPPLEPIV